MMVAVTLTEFLTARLDEDEAVARSARGDDDPSVWLLGIDQGSSLTPGDAIAMHPARALAEVEAKRRIVEAHPAESYVDVDEHYCRTCRRGPFERETPWPCVTLRLLALPYADHPQYDEAWRP